MRVDRQPWCTNSMAATAKQRRSSDEQDTSMIKWTNPAALNDLQMFMSEDTEYLTKVRRSAIQILGYWLTYSAMAYQHVAMAQGNHRFMNTIVRTSTCVQTLI